jgi:hypothetical protein
LNARLIRAVFRRGAQDGVTPPELEPRISANFIRYAARGSAAVSLERPSYPRGFQARRAERFAGGSGFVPARPSRRRRIEEGMLWKNI